MRRCRSLKLSALVLSVAAGASACSGLKETVATSGDPKVEASVSNIATFLAADEEERFTTLLDCVSVAGAAAVVTGTGPVTLFAPTNAAFAKAGVSCDTEAEADPEDAAALLRTLAQHVVNYDVRFTPPEDFDPDEPPRLLELVTTSVTLDSILLDAPGTEVIVASDKTVRTAANATKAKIIEADVQAPNGMIQVIDTVLTPARKAQFPPTTAAPKPYE